MSNETPYRLSVAEAQALCLKNNIPFYSYRLPGCDDVVFGAQLNGEVSLFQGFEKLQKEKGFVVSPFNPCSWSFPYFISAGLSFTNELTDREQIRSLQETIFDVPENLFEKNDIDYAAYREKVNYLIQTLSGEDIKKVIYSRTISITGDAFDRAPSLFSQLKQYAHAFIFLFSIPGKSVWLGASPETFLKYDRDGFMTMALGGTQVVKEGLEPQQWSPIEQEKQQIVTDYIQSILHPIFTRDLQQQGPFTVKAGNVYHLCTKFISDEQLPADEIDSLIRQLHPTPAVSGLPRKRALQLIAETEFHERGYYTGLVGPVQQSGAFDLFINLRSMELFKTGFKLYAGGGITPNSNSSDEWEETTKKAEILLNLIHQ